MENASCYQPLERTPAASMFTILKLPLAFEGGAEFF
jgi:hypothetical protein